MKHAREDYNRIQDPAGKIPENEPVFLLRGQDKFAPATLEFWGTCLAIAADFVQEEDPDKYEEMMELADKATEQASVDVSRPRIFILAI